MNENKYIWIIGLAVTILIVVVPVWLFLAEPPEVVDDPAANLPAQLQHTDHTSLIKGPFETGSEVTQTCLSCHENESHEVMNTSHWTWLSDEVTVEGRDEPIQTGKANLLNNFCIGIQSNWTGCTRCHTGYGWDSADFDFTVEENVDCLVCHDQSGGYVKSSAGQPAEGVDLVAAAQSVASPTRENCGSCHFNGGGGNAVKHGDLDESLYYPDESVDVHMGRYDFQCIDCHRTTDHEIAGRAISVSVEDTNQVYCTDCHTQNLHEDERINAHTETVACQTCHIPAGATRTATKMSWDWSTAGRDDIEEDPHEYLKIKGSFVYEHDFIPTYDWYNGNVDRYLLGDPINEDGPTILNEPHGDINDLTAKIMPFKVHEAKQIYDPVNGYLIQPKTVGEGGFWTEFDWDLASELGMEAAGLDYSGEYDFTETEMYWPQTHMVVPSENALQCTDCHSEDSRMDWQVLGYPGDPMIWGGRDASLVAEGGE